MVDRIKGGPAEGVWFSADVVFATLTVTNATFDVDIGADPAGVGSSLEVVVEAVETRGTVIALRVTSATVVELMIDFGQAYNPNSVVLGGQVAIDVLAEVKAEIDLHEVATSETGLDLTATFSNVGTDFTAG